MSYKVVPISKRVMDITLIVLTLPISLPIFLLIAGYIKLRSPGPVFFKQERVGCDGNLFGILKFRTMHINADTTFHERHVAHMAQNGRAMEKMDDGDPRIIPGCKVLRASGLDELPQLINVLKGEMSLVGPRPCTVNEFELFTDWTRFSTLPGLTGLWQVNGKNKTTFQRMMALDRAYVINQSMLLDIMIMYKTPMVLFKQVFTKKRKPIPIVLKEFDTEFVSR